MNPIPNYNPRSSGAVPVPARPLPAGSDPAPRLRPPVLSPKPTPFELLMALRRRWRVAAVLGLSCSLAAAAGVWFSRPVPEQMVCARLEVAANRPRIMFNTLEAQPDFNTYQRTQVALLRSRRVLQSALEGFEVTELGIVREQPDPIGWLDRELQVEFTNGSEILRIGLNSEAPREAVVLVNAITRIYLEDIVNQEHTERVERYQALKKLWEELQEDLKQKRSKLRGLAESAGSNDRETLAYMHQFEIQRLGKAQMDLMQVQSDLKQARVEARIVPDGGTKAEGPSSSLIDQKIEHDPGVVDYRRRIAGLQQTIGHVDYVARSRNDPAYVRATRDLKAAQGQLTAYVQRLRPVIVGQLREEARARIPGAANSLRERIAVLEALEGELRSEVEALTESTKSFNHKTLDLQAYQDEIAQSEEVAKRVGAEVAALDVELQAPPRVKLLDGADVTQPKDPRKEQIKMAGMAGTGTFLLVLAGISYMEFRSRRIGTVDEVVRVLGMPLVGSLPVLPSGTSGTPIETDKGPDPYRSHSLVESINTTRAVLLHASRVESFQAIMVTSAMSGEGKSTLSSHLAISFARAGRRTLLLDCDLRNPFVHKLFDLPRGPGLCEVLRGEASLDDVIQSPWAGELRFITAGRCDDLALDLLTQDRTRVVIDRLREQFEFIVIDSAPVLLVADAISVAPHVDAAIFSILHGYSRIPKVYAAYDRLAAIGTRMLGAVVSGVPADSDSTYGYTAKT